MSAQRAVVAALSGPVRVSNERAESGCGSPQWSFVVSSADD
jgi:hypothetical protein